MALRLHRRTLTLTSSLIRNYHHSISPISPSPSLVQSHNPSSSSFSFIPQNPINFSASSSHLLFRSSYSTRSYPNKEDDEKIDPDTILFEGCDYKHWLITMEFPKDHRPTPEEMVETYVQTAAKVVGSVEEAKRRIYACSTTTYQGFQIEVDEDTSEKFRGLPGVVFILPDSYIDPVNKEYGGDKYVNGTIIPRPPPIQYGRNNRYNDRNRNDRPRNDRPPYQGNQPYDRQGSPQGDGRNFGGAQQGYTPQHNYTQQQTYRPQQNYSQAPQQQNYPPQGYPPQGPPQGYPPQGPPQGYPPQGPPQGYPPQGPPQGYPSQGSPQPPQQNYSPIGGRDQRYQAPDDIGRGDNRNFGPSSGGDYRQGAGSSYGQSYPVEQKTGIEEDKRFYS